MSMGPSPPSVADTTAQATALGNQQQIANTQAGLQNFQANQYNQWNPYGSITSQIIGYGANGTPIYGTSSALTPQQQALFDVLQGTKGTAGGQGSSLLSGANYGAAQPSDVIGNASTGMAAPIVQQYKDFITPFQTTERDQLDTKLKNQGFKPGDPAYDNAMRGLDTNHSLANSKAIADYTNQAITQATTQYGLPLAMSQALAQFGAPNMPNSLAVNQPQLNIQPANYIGALQASNTAAMDAYKAQYQANSDMMSGMFGIPTALLGGWSSSPSGGAAITSALGALSDRRLKEDIIKIGELANGLNVYSFRYLYDPLPRVGLMADEVEQIMPEAVGERDGYKTVNYPMVLRWQ